jgi:hypothetical protein
MCLRQWVRYFFRFVAMLIAESAAAEGIACSGVLRYFKSPRAYFVLGL